MSLKKSGYKETRYTAAIPIANIFNSFPSQHDSKNPLSFMQHNYEHSPELSGEEESFLLFRYFLLSYLGIERLNEHEVYSALEQCQTLEPQIGG